MGECIAQCSFERTQHRPYCPRLMPPLAVVAALSSAFIHASWNAALKGGRDRVVDAFLIAVGGIIIWLFVWAVWGVPHAGAWPYLFTSVAIHLVYWFALFNAYDAG